MSCALRIDLDKDYEFVTRNKDFFNSYMRFVLKLVGLKPLTIIYKMSQSGNTHIYVYIDDGQWCKPPYKYFLESMLGGDIARTWYNYNRWKTLGRDVDILFISKRKKDYTMQTYIPEWFF